jgi:diguanylate cyclase (GGDEF)-like protein
MHFNDKFLAEWNRCGHLKLPLSIMMVDLDNFKQLNDSYGHLAGDKCLREVAKVMKAEIKRDTDSIARYGGEEFVVIISGQDLAASTKFAQKLINNIAEINLTWEQKTISVSCSIGLASMVPDKNINNQLLLKATDDAMYQAKLNGRNQYYIAQDLIETTKIAGVK